MVTFYKNDFDGALPKLTAAIRACDGTSLSAGVDAAPGLLAKRARCHIHKRNLVKAQADLKIMLGPSRASASRSACMN